LPKDRIEINVSAGLNLIKTPAYDLMRDMILLREEALRTNGEFHYRNVEKIFFNPYLPGGYKKWMEAVQYLKDGKILDHRDQVYFSAKELLEMMDEPIMEEIFKSDCRAVQLVQSILKVLEYAYELQQVRGGAGRFDNRPAGGDAERPPGFGEAEGPVDGLARGGEARLVEEYAEGHRSKPENPI
jgi:hypothetical protein